MDWVDSRKLPINLSKNGDVRIRYFRNKSQKKVSGCGKLVDVKIYIRSMEPTRQRATGQ